METERFRGDLISNVVPDYSYGRSLGLSDLETRRFAQEQLDELLEYGVGGLPAFRDDEWKCPKCWNKVETDYCGGCGYHINWSTIRKIENGEI